jgi:hypothetical protein
MSRHAGTATGRLRRADPAAGFDDDRPPRPITRSRPTQDQSEHLLEDQLQQR